jgi:uncharacterized protein (DUF2147 family)
MPFNRYHVASAALAAVLLASGQACAAPDPTGVWMNDTGRGAVEIKQCGGGLCGHVVWVKDTSDTKGCGRQIIGDAMPAGSGMWDNGWIYSPERQKKYDVELKPLDDGTLRVKGYAGTKLFSKTMIWTRAPSDITRCGETQAAAAPAAKPAQVATAGNTDPAPKTETTVKAASVEELQFRAKTKPVDGTAKVAAAEQPVAPAAPADAAPQASVPAAAAPEQEVAADDSASSDMSDIADKLGEFIKKGANGKCRLDLPWIKLDFKCEQ